MCLTSHNVGEGKKIALLEFMAGVGGGGRDQGYITQIGQMVETPFRVISREEGYGTDKRIDSHT